MIPDITSYVYLTLKSSYYANYFYNCITFFMIIFIRINKSKKNAIPVNNHGSSDKHIYTVYITKSNGI